MVGLLLPTTNLIYDIILKVVPDSGVEVAESIRLN